MKRKKISKLIVLTMLLLSCQVIYAAPMTLFYDGATHIYNEEAISLYVNSKAIDTPAMPAIQFEGRVVVPAREVFSAAGATVNYQAEENKVYVHQGNTLIILGINSTEAWVNGQVATLDMPAKLINGKVMIPVRFIGEKLGFKVDWEDATRCIKIYTPITSGDNVSPVEPVTPTIPVEPSTPTVETIVPDDSYEDNNIPSYIPDNEWFKEEHMTYDNSLEAIKLHNMTGLKCHQITVDEQYHTKQIVIYLNGNYETELPSGTWFKQTGAIRKLEVSTIGGSTKLILTTSTIQALKIYEEQDEIILQTVAPKEKYNKIVVIDAGHGAHDPGTQYAGVSEKDLVLSYANALSSRLKQNSDIKVYLTREDDTFLELAERTTFANEISPDLFISLHVNSAGSTSPNGTETYYTAKSDTRNKTFAEIVQKAIVNRFGTRSRGVKTNTFYVTKNTNAPAILVEIGFIGNDSDRAMMTAADFPSQYAEVLYECILQYYDLGLNY